MIEFCFSDCEVGHFVNLDDGGCNPCPLGKYSDTVNSEFCQQCAFDTTTRTTGAKSESECGK